MPLTKVKKLLNIIKSSDNLEAVDSFRGYVTEWLKQYDIEQKVKANSHVDAKDKAKELEKTCQHYMAVRSRFKKKSEQYEHWNELVKSTREEMNKQKRIASSSMADFKANLKNKDKFLKVLEFIEQGR